MRKLWKSLLAVPAALLALCGTAMAAGGKAAQIVIVSDTRDLTGILAWWSNLYNESHLQFTILTIVLIPVLGMILGLLTDLVMNHIGIDLTKRDVAEH
ncbi:DVU0150 family protein [Desulfovibrio aminophilus]|uniref:DVU0150 family protein n=1 Tax=Desulfovibrio aminophilus TaxID=81425 RepID=UPI0004229447|nr:DVU0150 family protein [Desulfovibrio aminophilus]